MQTYFTHKLIPLYAKPFDFNLQTCMAMSQKCVSLPPDRSVLPIMCLLSSSKSRTLVSALISAFIWYSETPHQSHFCRREIICSIHQDSAQNEVPLLSFNVCWFYVSEHSNNSKIHSMKATWISLNVVINFNYGTWVIRRLTEHTR